MKPHISINSLDPLLRITYGSLGLYVTAESLMQEATTWFVGDHDEWFIAAKRTPFGTKLIYAGTNGGMVSKHEMGSQIVRLASDCRANYYAEVSGSIEKMLERLRTSIPKVPAFTAEFVLQKHILPLDNYAYRRIIGGASHRKVMYGYPRIEF